MNYAAKPGEQRVPEAVLEVSDAWPLGGLENVLVLPCPPRT